MQREQKPRKGFLSGFLVVSTCVFLLGSGCRDPECDPRVDTGVTAHAASYSAPSEPTQTPEYWQGQWRKQVKEWWGLDLPESSEEPATRSDLVRPHALGTRALDNSGTDFGHGFERKWKVQRIAGDAGAQNVHFVIISEGYLAQDRKLFEDRAAKIADLFLDEETYRPYRKGITFWHAFAPSLEKGVTCDDNTTREKPTHFGASYPVACLNAKFGTTYNDRFVMVTEFAKIQSFLRYLSTITGGEKVVPFFLLQSDKYGGAAAPYAAMSISSPDEVAVHELGHSFGGLMDEYVAEGDPCLMFQALGPNISTDPMDRTRVKWAHWIDASTPVPTPPGKYPKEIVGFFRGAANCKMELFKPSQRCKMENHYESFCSVCKEQVILKLYETLRPARSEIRSQKLAGTRRAYRFQVDTLTHGIATRWWVDGKFAFESAQGAPMELELPPGRHEIAVQAQDPTPFVRRNRCQLAQTLKTSVLVP